MSSGAEMARTIGAQWRLLGELRSGPREQVAEAIMELVATHPETCLDHDLSWLEGRARANGGEVKVYVRLDGNGRLVGYAPFLVHPSTMSFSVGGHTFYEHEIRRYCLTSQPLLLDGQQGAEQVLISLFARVRKDLVGRALAFGLGIPTDSPFGCVTAGTAIRGLYHVIPHGPPYRRRLFRVPNSVDEYLALLGSKTRQDLRRQERRLLKVAGNNVRIRVHVEPDAVPTFLEAAEAISRRTYQWKQLQMGIRNSPVTRAQLEGVARRGWFRGYVLFCGGVPVAFMIGYLYRSVYYSESIGYDPAWAEWSVGNVLHLHVVRDLTRKVRDGCWFDFMYGDNSNKERLSTESRMEGNYYFIPRTLGWAPLVYAYQAFDRGTSVLNAVLDGLGMKGRIRRFLRRRFQG